MGTTILIMESSFTTWAWGFPWSLTPTVTNLTDSARIAEVVLPEKNPVLVSISHYPELHLFLRNPQNLVPVDGIPVLELAVYFMTVNNIRELLVVTPGNLTVELLKALDNPENIYMKLKLFYNIELPFNITQVNCVELYTSGKLNLCRVVITDRKG